MSERMNHSIEAALDKRGLVKMPDIHRPDYRIIQGWTNSIAKQHFQYDVAFIGDSHIYNGDFQDYFPNVKIINLGVSGNTLKDMQRQIPVLLAANPKKVYIMVGANDLVLEDVESFVKNYSYFINSLKQVLPSADIFVQSILPMNSMAGLKEVDALKIKNANERIKEISIMEKVSFIDLWSLYEEDSLLSIENSKDGLHLTVKGYSIWMQALKNFIK